MQRRHDVMTLNRRDLLKLGSGLLVGAATASRTTPTYAGPVNTSCAGQGYTEVHPTSPLVLNPFTDPLPVPVPLAPSDPNTWGSPFPPPNPNLQDSFGTPHQIWPSQLGLPDPIFYRIQLQVRQHHFTNQPVLPISHDGSPVPNPMTGVMGPQPLPGSTIYGFNGTFPGPMIYANYGQPALVRFENALDQNPFGLDRNDFGDPDFRFLTHLHNAHTAPESDGNPNHQPQAYLPGQYSDNLYLNYPAGNDPGEMQSFFWFHDHTMDHTGANVYKGMVGLYPIYDPAIDSGDERFGLRLPGVPNPVTRRVDYDIPLAFYDCSFDDGVTEHKDFHNGCGETHPEWWGQTYFRHFPNHGFVGDVFTTNGVVTPVLHVKRRKYRLRFLDASIARIYEFMLMSSTEGPVVASDSNPKKRQGQYRINDGQQCMQFHQIASEGGLLPFTLVRNSFEIWPAKRREVIVDFTRYMDGTPTTPGDVVWLVNTKQMTDGRKPDEEFETLDDGTVVPNPDFEPGFCCPMVKIVIGDLAPDNSLIPAELRPLPRINMRKLKELPTRKFTLHRSGTFGGEIEWLINGEEFHPEHQLAFPRRGVPEVWTIKNGGGGWVHPMHLHFEEHRVISRNGVPTPLDPNHPDDNSKEDVVALEPGEEVVLYRNFRTFLGKYVAHCHNLAHEDHAMMFGFTVVP